jgi:hypothetical protein
MAILQPAIERKLSSLLGANVSFEKLNVSLLGGSIEATGVRVGAKGESPPLLTIARVKASIGIKRALKGEIVITSLTIERPVLSLVRRGNEWNFPKRPAGAAKGKTSSAEGAYDDEKTSIQFDVEKLLLVDGAITATLTGGTVSGRTLSAGPIAANLTRGNNEYAVTLLADRVGCSNPAAELKAVGATGRIIGAKNLSALPDASAAIDFRIGDAAKIHFTSPRLSSLTGDVTFEGAFELAPLVAVLKSLK